MAVSTAVARQGLKVCSLASAVGRSAQQGGSRSFQTATGWRSLSIVRQQKQQLVGGLGSAAAACRAPCGHVFSLESLPSRRCLSTGGGKEDESDDDFKPQRKAVSTNPDEITELIRKQVESNKVMLYMKGTPSEPRCGFSAQVVRILHSQGVSFSSVNVLDYPAIREGVKAFSNWPTVPQVFMKGEFVGGCDILSQMHESGELATMLKKEELI